eukprot:COSAG01_NODE_1471_length_10198_cov_4.595703_3_plen_176_part_00
MLMMPSCVDQRKRVPKRLRNRVKRFMATLYEQKTGFDEREVLSNLPPAMAQELRYHLYTSLIVKVPIFAYMEEGAVTLICSLLKPYKAMGGDVIFKQGEAGREMFIVQVGSSSKQNSCDCLFSRCLFESVGAAASDSCLFTTDRTDRSVVCSRDSANGRTWRLFWRGCCVGVVPQ